MRGQMSAAWEKPTPDIPRLETLHYELKNVEYRIAKHEAKDTRIGRVSWFNPAKRFGFVKLDDHLGDAFLHFNVLKEGGYYFLPRGTTVHVRVEPDERGAPSVVEVLHVDPSTAQDGEPPPLLRKKRAEGRSGNE